MGAGGFYILAGSQVLKLTGQHVHVQHRSVLPEQQHCVTCLQHTKMAKLFIHETGLGGIRENSLKSRREWDFKKGPVYISGKNP